MGQTTGTTGRPRKRVRTGTKHRLRAPLLPPEAFRCSHWLATTVFVNSEKSHEGSIESYAKGYWHTFTKYDWDKSLAKQSTTIGAGLGIGIASFAVITAVGTVVGGPIGAAIGAAIGVVFGTGSAMVSLGIGALIDQAYHKYSRKDIDARLTRSDYKEKSSDPHDTSQTEPGHNYKVEKPISLHQLVDLLDVSPLEIWEHERNAKLRQFIESEATKTANKDCPIPNSEIPIPKGKKIWIPVDREDDPKVGDFRHESRKLTRLVQHSLRDAVVHLRKATAIYQNMPERLTGGRYYAPGSKETFGEAVAKVRKQYPGFEFLEDAILSSSRNPGTVYRHAIKSGETLESIARDSDCAWHEILEYEKNDNLRKFYILRKLWPEKEANRRIPLEDVQAVSIPRGILPADELFKYRLYEYDGQLEGRIDKVPNYLPAGQPIWIPAAKTLLRDSFKNCDEMISETQIAFEFIHHLNKFRDYLLPSLNLCQLYLDVYEEFAAYLEHAHAIVEDAVLEYQQFGEHDHCNMSGEFNTLLENWEMTRYKSWKNWQFWLFGSRFKRLKWKCMRDALKAALAESGKDTEYTVSDDNETFDSIAKDHKISVRALIAHNYRKRKISHDVVKYVAKDREWEIKLTSPGAGTTLYIPRSNVLDRLTYSDVWGFLNLGPEQSTGGFSGNYVDNYAAQVSIAEISIDDIRQELDKMIDTYHDNLNKNRETHHDDWYQKPKERQRYFWMIQDILHGLDVPGVATRIKHKFSNLDFKYTAGEKTMATLDAVVSVVGSALTSAISSGAGMGAKAVFPKVGAMDALKDLFFNRPGEDFLKYAGKTGIHQGTALSAKLAKMLVGLTVSLGGKAAEGSKTKEQVTRAHRLNFRKERMSVAAQLTGQRQSDPGQMSLKYAAKTVDDLFMKISRHALYAFVCLQKNVVPMVGSLENKSGEVGYGLKGCYDSVRHLKALYEYQHQVDKAERYLVASLALVKHLYDFEGFFSVQEKEIREVLVNSAGRYIIEGDHIPCRQKKRVGHRHCYGPGDKVAAKPYRPLRSRPKWDKPDRPSKEDRKPISEVRKEPPESN